jgi:DNA polymerase-3 subunit epsilon
MTQNSLPFLFPDQVTASPSHRETATAETASIDLQRLLIRADFIRPLIGKQIVFAGRLQQLSREDAESLAERLGGTCRTNVDDATDYLIMGSSGKGGSTESLQREQNRAEELRESGKTIQIVNETEFLGLVITPSNEP